MGTVTPALCWALYSETKGLSQPCRTCGAVERRTSDALMAIQCGGPQESVTRGVKKHRKEGLPAQEASERGGEGWPGPVRLALSRGEWEASPVDEAGRQCGGQHEDGESGQGEAGLNLESMRPEGPVLSLLWACHSGTVRRGQGLQARGGEMGQGGEERDLGGQSA